MAEYKIETIDDLKIFLEDNFSMFGPISADYYFSLKYDEIIEKCTELIKALNTLSEHHEIKKAAMLGHFDVNSFVKAIGVISHKSVAMSQGLETLKPFLAAIDTVRNNLATSDPIAAKKSLEMQKQRHEELVFLTKAIEKGFVKFSDEFFEKLCKEKGYVKKETLFNQPDSASGTDKKASEETTEESDDSSPISTLFPKI